MPFLPFIGRAQKISTRSSYPIFAAAVTIFRPVASGISQLFGKAVKEAKI
jgi:hypothetical protein